MEPTYIRGVQYSSLSSLNTLELCIPSKESLSDKSKIWVIFIHGGAWRDPTKLESIFDTSITHLLSSPRNSKIACFASLGYRLSPHPSHPNQPPDPNDPARTAKHPDHVNDILDGLAYLQGTYGFGERYILAGHSAGATLAFQVCMSRCWSLGGAAKTVVPPLAVVGLEGIYDIPALIAYHSTRPHSDIYDAFTHSAFGERYQSVEGERVDVWGRASPTQGDYERLGEGVLVVLAHSREDELVEWEQVELVRGVLEQQGWGRGGRRLEMLELRGRHDEVWEEGGEVARAVEVAVGRSVEVLGE
ncbi:Alpha/Beta hydrolase protein [Delphinella strobiligena]|nr:Alpha/Beta hydrolase protein [Delphinella strobiligena]